MSDSISISQISFGTAALLGLTVYSTYVVTSWLFYAANTPSTNRRLVAAKKKGKTATIMDIPGPRGLPFLGTLLDMWPYIRTLRMDKFVDEFSIKYQGLFRLQTHKIMVNVDDCVMAKKIANTPDVFVRSDQLTHAFSESLPTALFALPSGDQWKKHRKGLQPAFGPTHLRDAFQVSLEYADELLNFWESNPCRNVHVDFAMVTGDVIAKIAFSAELGAVKSLSTNNQVDFFQHTESIVAVGQIRLGLIARKYLWPIIGLGSSSVRSSVDYIMGFLNKLIDERRQKHQSNIGSSINAKDYDYSLDLLDRLLMPEAKFTDEEIRGEMFGFFLAGHETTANTLTFTLLELAKNPRVYDKLYEEINQVLGTEKPTNENLNSLKYLDAVLKEAMRLHTVIIFIVRDAIAHYDLVTEDGLTIHVPPGTRMIVNMMRMHHHKKYWGENADEYVPERWDNGFVPIPGSYLPFGDGPMNCIGQKMALIEAKVVLIRIVQRFKSVALSPNHKLTEPVTSLTRGMKHGLMLDVVKR